MIIMIVVKELTPDNSRAFLNLLMELAEHHNQERYVQTNMEQVVQGLTDSMFQGLLAFHNNEPVGYASYTWNYSIWTGAQYMNLDDLFVKESFRGQSIGKLLMDGLKESCVQKKVNYVRWEVQLDNLKAVKFYENLGAEMSPKGIFKWMVNQS